MNPATKRTYYSWRNMLDHSTVEHPKRWEVFAMFLLDMGLRPVGRVLTRRDGSLPYSKGNCMYASRTFSSRLLERCNVQSYQGLSLPLAEWARRYQVPYQTLVTRINRGWTIERALTTPVQPHA